MNLNKQRKKVRRGIYILPNLFTIAALFSGFYAIVSSMNGKHDIAAISIFVAMLFDCLDGRVARLTNTQTEFGAQLDSLSDMVSFGVAPALVLYKWILLSIGKVGWLAAFVYAVSVALRLARFNTQIGKADKRYFQGLACTPAAGAIAGLVWFSTEYNLCELIPKLSIIVAFISVMLAALMVSTIRFRSFKDIDLRNNVSFLKISVISAIIVFIAIEPSLMLFVLFFCYATVSPVVSFIKLRKKQRIKKRLNLFSR